MFNLSEALAAKFDTPPSFLRLRTDESAHNETAFNKSVDKLIKKVENLERANREEEAYGEKDHKNALFDSVETKLKDDKKQS